MGHLSALQAWKEDEEIVLEDVQYTEREDKRTERYFAGNRKGICEFYFLERAVRIGQLTY